MSLDARNSLGADTVGESSPSSSDLPTRYEIAECVTAVLHRGSEAAILASDLQEEFHHSSDGDAPDWPEILDLDTWFEDLKWATSLRGDKDSDY